MFDYERLIDQLSELREESYATFSSSLLPGTSSIWGIRLPNLRKIAKEMRKVDVREYLVQVRHEFFEETMLMGFVIGIMEESKYPKEEILYWVKEFLLHIDNWSICDSFCTSLKIATREPDQIFEMLLDLLHSNTTLSNSFIERQQEAPILIITEGKEFTIRFVIVMWLIYYTNEKYVNTVIENLLKIKSNHYYVNMAIAWCYSMIYLEFPEIVERNLKLNYENQVRLSSSELFVHNKTISKICESLQVEENQKNYVKSLKIKRK